jgi:hypothetical protein
VLILSYTRPSHCVSWRWWLLHCWRIPHDLCGDWLVDSGRLQIGGEIRRAPRGIRLLGFTAQLFITQQPADPPF